MKKNLVERFARFHANFPLDDVYLALPARRRNDAYLYLLALNGHQRAKEADGNVPLAVANAIASAMGLKADAMLSALEAVVGPDGLPRVILRESTQIQLLKYAKWQDSPEEIAELKAKRSESGIRGAQVRWGKQTDSNAIASAIPNAMASANGKNGKPIAEREIEREKEREKESLNTPPSPPTRRLSVVKDGYDDATAELAVGMHELLGRQLSTTEILECQVALNQYAYLSPAEMVDRAGAHLEYCKAQSPPLPTPRTVGGFSDSWRRHNDYLSDHGGAKADRVQLGRTGGLTRAFSTESDISARTPREGK